MSFSSRHRWIIDQEGNEVHERPSRMRAVMEMVRRRDDDDGLEHDRPNTGPDDLAGVSRMPFTIHRIRMRSLKPVLSLAVAREPQGDALELRPVQAVQQRGSRTVVLDVPDLLALTPDRERLALLAFEREAGEQVDWTAELRAQMAVVEQQLADLRGWAAERLRNQHSLLGMASLGIKRMIGPARRFATPAGDVARIAEAYADGGTGQVAKLTPELIAEMDARAKAAAA